MDHPYIAPTAFVYGSNAKSLIRNKQALPLCGKKNIGFTKIIFNFRNRKNFCISVKEINNYKNIIAKKINNLTRKRKSICNLNLDFPKIFGVLNITPDSFSDGGKFYSTVSAVKQGGLMIKEGAHIIDIGGESTRPGAITIAAKTEIKRIKDVVKKLNKNLISIDTRKSEVMSCAINLGANIINDVSALDYDKNSFNYVLKTKKPIVLNHSLGTPDLMQKNPRYKNVLFDIYDYFEKKIDKLVVNGYPKKSIILDPGIGFGKNVKHNLELISKVSIFHSLGCPLMLGPSRKSFIGKIMKENFKTNRIGGTIASIIMGLNHGVQFFRVHDITECNEAIKIYEHFLNT